MSKGKLKSLLHKYLQGKATAAESAQIESWYASFREAPLSAEDKERLHAEILGNILQQVQTPAPVRSMYWKYAAAIIILLASTGAFYIFKKEKPVVNTDQWVSTPAGSRKTIRLPDGTTVQLNAGTALLIPGDFGVKDRAVTLKGEAFFIVATDAAHPFIIHTDSIQTTVLGTAFNIRAWPGEDTWEIGVTEGRVKVGGEKNAEIMATCLTAGKGLLHHQRTNTSDITDLNTAMTGAWRNNIFHFNNSSMSEIGQELQRQYNIPVIVRGEGKDRGHYKISFSREPLEQVLKVLAGLTGITYTIQQEQIIIEVPKTV